MPLPYRAQGLEGREVTPETSGWVLLSGSKKVQRQSMRLVGGKLRRGNGYQCLKNRLERGRSESVVEGLPQARGFTLDLIPWISTLAALELPGDD